MNGLQPVESLLHALGKRIVRGGRTCVLCIPEDAAIHLRYDQRTQPRDGMRIGEICAVGMPEHAGIVTADVLAVLLDVRYDEVALELNSFEDRTTKPLQ